MTNMSTAHLPTNKRLLAALGEVTLSHEHLTHILRLAIKSIADITVNEAIDATEGATAAALRRRVCKLARQRLGEGKPLLKLEALIQRCEAATTRRNSLVHAVWEKDSTGITRVRGKNRTLLPIPTTKRIAALALELRSLAHELNEARLSGFLADALQAKKK